MAIRQKQSADGCGSYRKSKSAPKPWLRGGNRNEVSPVYGARKEEGVRHYKTETAGCDFVRPRIIVPKRVSTASRDLVGAAAFAVVRTLDPFAKLGKERQTSVVRQSTLHVLILSRALAWRLAFSLA
jgi:hypothetical protein